MVKPEGHPRSGGSRHRSSGSAGRSVRHTNTNSNDKGSGRKKQKPPAEEQHTRDHRQHQADQSRCDRETASTRVYDGGNHHVVQGRPDGDHAPAGTHGVAYLNSVTNDNNDSEYGASGNDWSVGSSVEGRDGSPDTLDEGRSDPHVPGVVRKHQTWLLMKDYQAQSLFPLEDRQEDFHSSMDQQVPAMGSHIWPQQYASPTSGGFERYSYSQVIEDNDL